MSGVFDVKEHVSSPSPSPASGRRFLYPKSDGWKDMDDNGAERNLFGTQTFTASTTDATPTNVSGAEILLSEDQTAFVEVMVQAYKDDFSAGLGAKLWVVARRATGGNVTLVGTVQGTPITDGVTPTVTLVADTTAQAVDVQITGVAAENWEWEILLYGRTF